PRPGTFLDQLARATYQSTEPLMGPIRRAMPNTGPLDFSPFIALIALNIIERIVKMILGLIF
ncbi:MAG: YggT family protein, partial [Actinobacteria bacterium]|nr:YggT family protein [Actinomycetota bacterium]